MDSHPNQQFSSDDDDTMAGVYNAWSKCAVVLRVYTLHAVVGYCYYIDAKQSVDVLLLRFFSGVCTHCSSIDFQLECVFFCLLKNCLLEKTDTHMQTRKQKERKGKNNNKLTLSTDALS